GTCAPNYCGDSWGQVGIGQMFPMPPLPPIAWSLPPFSIPTPPKPSFGDVDSFGRPSWDDVYMAMAFIAARRSMDPRTKHGCVIVSKDNRPLTWGCNGPLKGILDSSVPLTAPEKYYHMIPAEANALLAYCG